MSLYINDKTTGATNLISGSERPNAALDKVKFYLQKQAQI